jgi:NADPH-dependent 2,4-dienoyl-CoA reductase/sulfur reductase-like enzyme
MQGDRFVIVGSGIAGLAAAEELRRQVSHAQITMVSEEPHNFYSRPGLAYLLRKDVPEKQLFVRTAEDLRALQVSRVHLRVERLLPNEHELILAGGDRLPFDRLLVATGALAVPPPFPGGDLQGVVKLDGLDDTRKIIQLARWRKRAVVVGGGITALELAEGLRARRMRTRYFLRGARYWSDVLDETESRIVEERLQHEGVTLHKNTQVKQALGKGGRVCAVETQAGEIVPCDVLAVAIGVRPRADLAREAGLKVDRGVVVDEYLQASAPDIFAAGDVAQVYDPRSGRATLDVLWPTALAQGQVAGANMAGARRPYVKGVAFNVTQLAGLKVTIIGAVGDGRTDDLVAIARGDSEAWRLLPQAWVLAQRDDVNRVRLLVGERTIVGALVMGDQTWSRPLHRLVSEQTDISAVRPALIRGGPEALEQLAHFYRRLRKTGSGSL